MTKTNTLNTLVVASLRSCTYIAPYLSRTTTDHAEFVAQPHLDTPQLAATVAGGDFLPKKDRYRTTSWTFATVRTIHALHHSYCLGKYPIENRPVRSFHCIFSNVFTVGALLYSETRCIQTKSVSETLDAFSFF